MKGAAIQFFKLLMVSTILGILLCTLAFVIPEWHLEHAPQGVFCGIFFGIVFSTILFPLHLLGIIFANPTGKNRSFGVFQTKTFSVDLPCDEFFELCNKDLDLNIKTIEANKSLGLIAITTRRTWKSHGEKVTLKFLTRDEMGSKIIIESKPVIWTTIADYGKNLENVEAVTRDIQSRIATWKKDCSLIDISYPTEKTQNGIHIHILEKLDSPEKIN